MRCLFCRLVLSIVLGYALVQPTVVIATGWQQSAIATLRLENQSDQAITVCAFAILQEPYKIVLNSDEQIVLAPRATKTFDLAPGGYIIQIDDCAGHNLFEHSDLNITDSYTVRLGKPNGATSLQQSNMTRLQCESLNIEGKLHYGRGEFDQALQAFESALVCVEQIGFRTEESIILNNIAAIYQDQGRYTDALTRYQQALDIERELGHPESEGPLLNNIAAIYQNQGRYADALHSYQQALDLAREIGNRAEEGTAHNNIGTLYNDQGNYAEALTNFKFALEIKQEIGDRRGEGQTLNNIGLVYDNQGRYPNALASYEQALKIEQEIGDQADQSITLNNIGAVYRVQGRYAEALAMYQQGLEIKRKVGNRAGEGIALNNIGQLYDDQGHYAEALATYQQALIIMQATGNRTAEGIILSNIGLVYDHQRRYVEALDSEQKAYNISREIGDRAGEGTALNNIGLVAEHQERYVEALSSYQQALIIMQAIGNRTAEGIILSNIGRVYEHQGRYVEALDSEQKAYNISRAVGDRVGEGIALKKIGQVYDSQGRYAEALASYQQALKIIQEVGDRTQEGQILNNIGDTYRKQGHVAEALNSYQAGINVLESVRAVAGDDLARTSFAEGIVNAYGWVIELTLNQQPELAFNYSERGRARVLLDILSTGQIQLQDNKATELLTKEQEAYAVRQSAQDALAKTKALNPPDPKLVSDLGQQLLAAQATYTKTVAAIQARRDQLGTFVPGRINNVLSVTQVQALLDNQTTLVSYWMLVDKTVAFIVTADDFTVVELPGATTTNISTTVQSLYGWVKKEENPYPRPLRDLYKWLVEPLADHLHTPHVAIVPHQELHYVPFAALTDGNSYFGEQHTLTVLPSASALRFLADNARKAESTGVDKDKPSALIFGNPKTDLPSLADLPSAETEATAVASLLDTTVYTGINASELELRTVVSGTSILHLAAHGGYDSADPLASLIALAPGGGEDGRLETREIFGLPLTGSNLVVLSACQTNVGQLSRGDEVVGLTRAFFFAGTPTVISSLWSVDDAATETLMVSFYRHWLEEGMSKAAALQAAQAAVRTNPQWVSPFYWAGFVLNGDPGKSNRSPSPANSSG